MLTPELKKQLKATLPINCHELRDLPGGGIYAFISWQKVRERLDEICNFEIEFNDPVIVDDVCCIRCTIAIEEVKRQGLGVCSVVKKGIRGTFVESAVADAFKNAAEQFGIGAYLDDPQWQQQLKTNASLLATYKQKKAGQHPSNGGGSDFHSYEVAPKTLAKPAAINPAKTAASNEPPAGWKPAYK